MEVLRVSDVVVGFIVMSLANPSELVGKSPLSPSYLGGSPPASWGRETTGALGWNRTSGTRCRKPGALSPELRGRVGKHNAENSQIGMACCPVGTPLRSLAFRRVAW